MQPVYLPPAVRKKRRPSLLLQFLGFVFATGVVFLLVGAAAAGLLLWNVSRDLPDYEKLANYEPPVMTRLHAADGSLIAEYARERRIYVPINNIPKRLISAFLAAEDHNFYQHGGLDFTGIARAILIAAKGGRVTGASTITQQVAKNFLLTSERNFDRKLKEAILAIRIEQAYSKQRILELYLNEIYLGIGSYGVAAASLNYYGKELHELTIAEAAYLAALPKGPNNYHPFKKEKEAIGRRNWVISQMAEHKFITQEEAAEAVKQPLGVSLRPFGAHIFAAEYFAEQVRRSLVEQYGEQKLYDGGLSVRTTLDPLYQRYAKKALVDGLVRFDRQHGWRGPIQKIDVGGDWGALLGAIPVLADIDPWRLAVVLEVTDEALKIGLQPKRLPNGSLEEARGEAVVSAKDAEWVGLKKGKSLPALFAAGDVVYVGAGRRWQ